LGDKEGDSHKPHVPEIDRNVGNTKTIVRNTKHHKERGKTSSENNAQSPAISYRSILPKINHQPRVAQQRKNLSNNSGDDEEIKPP
jgi:hypothetical protein